MYYPNVLILTVTADGGSDMSIKRSLRIILTITSIIPVILIAIIVHGLFTNRMIAVQTQNLQRIAEMNRSGLKAMIEIQTTEVSLLSIQNELIYLTKNSDKSMQINPTICNNLFKERKKSYRSCEMISLYNEKGKMIASSNSNLIGQINKSYSTLSYINATKKIAIGIGGINQLKHNGKTINTIEIGCPIFENNENTNKIIGYVVSTLRISYFKDFLGSITIGKTGYGILLDQDGTIIYHPKSSLSGKNINLEELSSLINEYKNGNVPLSGSFSDPNNNSGEVYGYSIIPELDWILIVKQNLSELRSPTEVMLLVLLLVCILLFVIIIYCSNNLAKRFSAPIIALRDAMCTASEGNLSVQSNIKRNDELGELSKSFNKMMHIINTNYEDLASMHEKLLSNEEQLRSNYDHIEYLAYHDTLTNLPNKLAFLDYINATLSSPQLKDKIHSVYFVDLDNFKTVNDTLGHEYGDALLVKTAQILTSIIDGNGMLARAGGDEFLMITENISSKEVAADYAKQIIDSFRNPLDLNGEIVYVSMSIGIALYPDNGILPNSLIKNADIAMYKSKDTGKNKYTIFDRKMEDELNRNTLIIEVLRNAIDNKEIYVQYQPMFELNTNNVIGFEALMRIRSNRLGSICPDEFIPIAEESGLIIELGTWLLREACSFNKELIDQGFMPRLLSVNISSVQINRPGFIKLLSEILDETGLPPQYLELEITESTLVSSILDTTELLTNLQKLGVKISLDDFGTGYSSLNYLAKMPINTLKIDKSFIDNICISKKDAYMAESIIHLAHSLHIKVVAEGVEQEDQLTLLRSKKCDIIQGFLFSPPLHSIDLIDVIRERRNG